MHAAFTPYLLCSQQVNKESVYLRRLGNIAVNASVMQPPVAVPEPVSVTPFHFFQHHGCLHETGPKGRSPPPCPLHYIFNLAVNYHDQVSDDTGERHGTGPVAALRHLDSTHPSHTGNAHDHHVHAHHYTDALQ